MKGFGLIGATLMLLLVPALSAGAQTPAPAQAQAPADADARAVQLVRDFHASWQEGRVDALLAYLSEDCYYENIPPVGPVGGMTGQATIRAFLADVFNKDALTVPYSLTAEVKQIVAAGDTVTVERIDHFAIGKSHIALPVLAIFKIKDGKITSWRDYFDGDTLKPALYLMQALKRST